MCIYIYYCLSKGFSQLIIIVMLIRRKKLLKIVLIRIGRYAFGVLESYTNFCPSEKHLYYLLKANHLTCRVSKYD